MITLETTFTLLITSSRIWIHVLVSLYRVMLGILLGTVFSIPMGILLGYSKRIEKYFGEAFDFLYMIPKIVFLPIFFVLLGIGDLSKIALIATVLFFQQTILIRDNVKNISGFFLANNTARSISKLLIRDFYFCKIKFRNFFCLIIHYRKLCFSIRIRILYYKVYG